MVRLFVAIRPPAQICDRLIAVQGGVEGARWQDDDQLHLTLRFIGAVDARTGDDILTALGSLRAEPFDIALSGVGSFEHKGRTDTLWAGISPRDTLASLHKKIDHALVRAGLPSESRAYRPHITLARGRLAQADAFLNGHATLTSPPFTVSHFGLYESTLGSGGACYALVERWPLG
jgi:RNA 2',3'-cyclic 3'-phosphodiesterase